MFDFKSKNKLNKSTKIFIVIAVVVAVAGLLSSYLGTMKIYSGYKNIKPKTVNIQEKKTSTDNDNAVSEANNLPTVGNETTRKISALDPGVKWLSSPKELGDLKLFKENYLYYSSDVSYYKIGDLPQKREFIVAIIDTMGMPFARFIKNSDGEYYFLKNYSEDYLSDELAPGVLIDRATKILSLSPPSSLKINNILLVRGSAINSVLYNFGGDIQLREGETTEKFATIDYGDIFVNEYKRADFFTSKTYWLKLADTSKIPYTIKKDFFADDGSLVATFNNNGESFKNRFFRNSIFRGCGFVPDDMVVHLNYPEKLIEIGKTKNGSSLYALVDKNEYALKEAFQNSYQVDDISYNEFVERKPVIVWKDPVGDYLFFRDSVYDVQAECAKPVIYLYPTESSKVSVKVGANITQSEPVYGNGWKVTAQPDGQLINQDGKVYDSLFWDGTGFGFYPAIKRGRVVATKNIENELRADLSKLGLNKKETQDFLDFWLDKMPSNPYTRLTWLGTQEMNELAPLSIQPKPDTLIRVFLDFTGQDDFYTNLAPQDLNSIKREGFTVVEWGGLLVK